MRLLRLFAFWACLVSTAAAPGREIWGPGGTVKPPQPVWLEIAGVPEGAAASFFPSDVLTTGPPHLMPRHALFHADAAGAYHVNAFVTVVDWQARTITTTPLSIKIVVGQPEPPPPAPATEITGVVIYELDDPSQQKPEYAQIMYGPSIRKLLEGRWHCVDDDVSGQLRPFVAAALAAVEAEKLPEPHLFLFDQDGRQIHRGPLPGSVEAAAAKIREFLR